jgi:hypothetical protein
MKFTVIFNVRINSEERFDRLVLAINSIPKFKDLSFSIRVRGTSKNFNFPPIDQCSFYFGSSWNDWNLDLIEQITRSPTLYYILVQEDHLLNMNQLNFESLLHEIVDSSVDYLPLSFYPHYQNFVNEMSKNYSTTSTGNLIFWDLDKRSYSRIQVENRNYPLNLLGVYKKELLLKMLTRARPFYKQYSIQTPFNFEINPKENWFLPIRWAYPKSEVFACIDDDHGIKGYSIVSRGEYQSKIKRVVEHHDKLYIDNPRRFNFLLRFFVGFLKTDVLVLPRNIKYSIEYISNFNKRRRIIRQLLSGR